MEQLSTNVSDWVSEIHLPSLVIGFAVAGVLLLIFSFMLHSIKLFIRTVVALVVGGGMLYSYGRMGPQALPGMSPVGAQHDAPSGASGLGGMGFPSPTNVYGDAMKAKQLMEIELKKQKELLDRLGEQN